ncbi:hypothetical protein [Okeania sp. SIO2B3]|uniref:hypothetical protein n=1 Tax=Okeania sp. SIO2B3 TaxID=2607784 RepID=UPI0013C024F3|nr:hypothetical protein [Okeania sp. SIO2B3]NET45382.1 hypothetical protein [Okeania sp. SIO2B3]
MKYLGESFDYYDQLFEVEFINSKVSFNNITWIYKSCYLKRSIHYNRDFWYLLIDNEISKSLIQRFKFSSKLIRFENIPIVQSKVVIKLDDSDEVVINKIRKQIDWKLSRINANTLVGNPKSFEYLERVYLEEHLFDLWYEEHKKDLDELFPITAADKEINFNRRNEIEKRYLEWFRSISSPMYN